MKISLASTWNPRGELPRIERLSPQLNALYACLVVVVPPDTDAALIARLAGITGVEAVVADDWTLARHHAVRHALREDVGAVHACDLDRLLHWLEVAPAELNDVLAQAGQDACLVLGRTEQAWATHPRCMIETEVIFNRVFSHLLGSDALIDFGAGSKLFSRAAAEFVLRHTPESWGWAIDAAWPLMLHRAGWPVAYRAVDGLAWETPDQFLPTVAGEDVRRELAAAWDADAARWDQRVWVAREITRVGLEAARVWPVGGA